MQTLMTSTLNSAGGPSTTLIMSLTADGYSGSGTTWTDYSGNGYNATLVNGPAYTNTVPKYFTFSRSSTQYVQGQNIGSFATWTIESWFRLTEPLSNTEASAIVTTTYEDGTGNLYNVINYTLSSYVAGAPGYNSVLTAGFYVGGLWYTTAGFVPTVGSWYHVVGTYDGTILKQWVNGEVISGTVSVTATPTANGGPVRIARRWDGQANDTVQYFPGDIATVKIYNGVLSDAEILASWNGSRATYGY
jgi:hypothetical protein